MRISAVLVIAAVAGATPTLAQSGVQSQRLIAKGLSLGAQPADTPLAAIWQDRLAAERQKLASLAKSSPASPMPSYAASVAVFEASFKDGDRTIIVSALFTTPECQNFSGAAAPSLNNCPMRVAILRNGQIRVAASELDFPFVATLKETPDNQAVEYDNVTQRDKTIVVFNPATHEITTTLTMNGVLDTEKATPIHVAY